MSEAAPATKPARGNKPELRREIELDFVRGLAILLVMDAHTTTFAARLNLPIDPGAFGVSMFFVLSGFLVGGILIREWVKYNSLDAGRFLIRRGLKIWPQYYAFLILMVLTGHRTFHSLIGNFLNVQNYITGVVHTWSLAVEEHAYLLLTLLFFLVAKYRAKKHAVLIGLIAVSVLCAINRDILASMGGYVVWKTQYRIDGILWGIVLAILYQIYPERFLQMQKMRALWVAGLLLMPAYRLIAAHFPSRLILDFDFLNIAGISVFMLLYRRGARTRTFAPNRFYRAVAWIGLYSYGIYLWHVSVVAPVFHLADRLHLHLPEALVGLFAAVTGAILGIVMTEVVELPTLRLRDRLFPRKVPSPLEVGTEQVIR